MLDSRTELSLLPAIVPDYIHQELPITCPFPRIPFLPGIKPSVPFSSPHLSGHMQGALCDSDTLRKQYAERVHSLMSAPLSMPHLAPTEHRSCRPGAHMITMPRLSTPTQWLDENHRACRRVPAHSAFPPTFLAFSGALNSMGSCFLEGSHDKMRHFTRDSEPDTTAQYIKAQESFGPRNLSTPAPELSQTATPFQTQWDHDAEWRKPLHATVYCHGLQDTQRSVETDAQGVQENSKKSAVTVDGCPLNEEMEDASPVPSPRLLTVSNAAAASQYSVTLTQQTKPQESVADLTEPCTWTSGEHLRDRKGPAGHDRHRRQKRLKKLRAVTSSLTFRNGKMTSSQQAEDQQSIHSDTAELQEEQRKVLRCPQCRYVTDRKNNLKRHVVTMHHKTTRLLECCGTLFHSKASLRDHVTIHHRGGYRCQVCSRNFCRKALLRRHLTVHSGQKDFACQLCGYATSHKSNLERHQRVHARKIQFSGHHLPRHHHGKEEPATFTCDGTLDYDRDYASDTDSTKLFTHDPSHSEELDSLKSQTNSDNPILNGQDYQTVCVSTMENTGNSYTFTDGTTSTVSAPYCDFMSSRKPERQFVEESHRVCRDSTNLSPHVTCRALDSVYSNCFHCSPTAVLEPCPSTATAAVRAFQSGNKPHSIHSENKPYSMQSENKPHSIPSENKPHSIQSENKPHSIQSENKPYSRPWALSRKVCFPNRLHETYQASLHQHAPMTLTAGDVSDELTLTAGDVSDELEEAEHNGNDADNVKDHADNVKDHADNVKDHADNVKDHADNVKDHADNVKDHADTSAENLKENEVPSYNTLSRSSQPFSFTSEADGRLGNHANGDTDTTEPRNEADKRHDKRRLCRLLYRCSGCRAHFAHQGELVAHLCHFKGDCIFHFPFTSSVRKGCIKVSPADKAT